MALLGIMGALMGAVVTASRLLGQFAFLEVMRFRERPPIRMGSQDECKPLPSKDAVP